MPLSFAVFPPAKAPPPSRKNIFPGRIPASRPVPFLVRQTGGSSIRFDSQPSCPHVFISTAHFEAPRTGDHAAVPAIATKFPFYELYTSCRAEVVPLAFRPWRFLLSENILPLQRLPLGQRGTLLYLHLDRCDFFGT